MNSYCFNDSLFIY